ncbi:hypothetical protein C4566_03520 [Candidatus Parcubacteria bacterium]|nr:MAG: hypothetical protein C4566_03520 [Candidatus Parcubacteria bacterium]
MEEFKCPSCFYCDQPVNSKYDFALGTIFPSPIINPITDVDYLEVFHKNCHRIAVTTNAGYKLIAKKMLLKNNSYKSFRSYGSEAYLSGDKIVQTPFGKLEVLRAKLTYWTGTYVVNDSRFIINRSFNFIVVAICLFFLYKSFGLIYIWPVILILSLIVIVDIVFIYILFAKARKFKSEHQFYKYIYRGKYKIESIKL